MSEKRAAAVDYAAAVDARKGVLPLNILPPTVMESRPAADFNLVDRESPPPEKISWKIIQIKL